MRLFLPAVLVLTLAFAVTARADECWIHTPPGYQRMGGAARIGPYADWYEAQRVNHEYFQGQGNIDCRKTGGGGGQPRFKYGAVKIHNRTSVPLTFSVRAKPGGAWQRATVKSGAWYWWWQECPCRFHCTWDGSTAAGNQVRTQEVYWYGYSHKPSPEQAREWQFVQRGRAIVLIAGSGASTPTAPPRAPARPGPTATVSFVGRGEGQAHAQDFRTSKVADGTWQMTFLPRVNGAIPTLNGTWRLQWKRILGARDDPVRVEIWNLSLSGLHGAGRREQAVDVRMRGGAGAASFFTTRVPGHPAAGMIKFRVGIQFSGRAVRLSFTRAY